VCGVDESAKEMSPCNDLYVCIACIEAPEKGTHAGYEVVEELSRLLCFRKTPSELKWHWLKSKVTSPKSLREWLLERLAVHACSSSHIRFSVPEVKARLAEIVVIHALKRLREEYGSPNIVVLIDIDIVKSSKLSEFRRKVGRSIGSLANIQIKLRRKSKRGKPPVIQLADLLAGTTRELCEYEECPKLVQL